MKLPHKLAQITLAQRYLRTEFTTLEEARAYVISVVQRLNLCLLVPLHMGTGRLAGVEIGAWCLGDDTTVILALGENERPFFDLEHRASFVLRQHVAAEIGEAVARGSYHAHLMCLTNAASAN